MREEIGDDNMKWIAQLTDMAALKDGRHSIQTDIELN
jgi:hypothetical protein